MIEHLTINFVNVGRGIPLKSQQITMDFYLYECNKKLINNSRPEAPINKALWDRDHQGDQRELSNEPTPLPQRQRRIFDSDDGELKVPS
jgi:hypothetical protein